MINYPQELLNNIESACINYIPKDVYDKYLVNQFDILRKELDFINNVMVKEKYMYEQAVEDAKFLKETVEPNLKVLKETYKYKPVTVLETPDRLEDNLVGNVVSNGSSLVDFKKETSVQNISSEWESNVNANKDIDEALLNLDCWIDSNKEDGTTYNAIGWWNMLETFKECKKKLEEYEKADGKA